MGKYTSTVKMDKAASAYIVIPEDPYLNLTAAEKKGGLKALDAIREVFGPRGEYWLQGEYHEVIDGVEHFCLSGAAAKANGRYEPVARAALALACALDGSDKKTDVLYATDLAIHPIFQGKSAQRDSDDAITFWNDERGTTFKDVLRIFKAARALLK